MGKMKVVCIKIPAFYSLMGVSLHQEHDILRPCHTTLPFYSLMGVSSLHNQPSLVVPYYTAFYSLMGVSSSRPGKETQHSCRQPFYSLMGVSAICRAKVK